MSLHRKDWLKLLGVGAAGIAGAGMFGMGPLAAMMGGEAAAAPAAEGLSAGGLFGQVPGVSAGSQQAAMLAAQNEGFGGVGANMTAQAAMPAVNAARASGQMGLADYVGNVMKGNFAGVNDPSVLASRAAANVQRMAGGAGRTVAANVAMNALSPPSQPPQPMMPRQPPQMPMGGGEDVNTLMARAQQGDPAAMQKLRELMAQMGVR